MEIFKAHGMRTIVLSRQIGVVAIEGMIDETGKGCSQGLHSFWGPKMGSRLCLGDSFKQTLAACRLLCRVNWLQNRKGSLCLPPCWLQKSHSPGVPFRPRQERLADFEWFHLLPCLWTDFFFSKGFLSASSCEVQHSMAMGHGSCHP